MLDECIRTPLSASGLARYTGPERRSVNPPPLTRWLTLMLDEMDHGMLLVTHAGRLRHANEPARRELSLAQRLAVHDQQVRAVHRQESLLLAQALLDARRGRRCLLWLGAEPPGLSVAVVPLPEEAPEGDALVLLVLGRRQPGEALTIDFYARAQGLTDAEARVLRALCSGLGPKQVAHQFDVAVSTVRTQISSIRHKTQTASIRELISRVAALPPITMAMKSGFAH